MLKLTKAKNINLTIIAVLFFAGAARIWGIGFGLPNTACRPDEKVIIDTALMFGRGNINPGWFYWPTFYMYLLFFCYAVYFLFGIVSGKYVSMIDFIAEYTIDPSNFYLIDRILASCLGTVTVFIVYKAAKCLFDKKIAIISSFFLSLAYLHVRDSHFGVTDIPATFLITCAFLFIVKSYKDKTLKNYVYAGIFTGLATATKYGGVLLLVPMFIVHFFNSIDKRLETFLNKRILSFLIVFTLAFSTGTPFALLDLSNCIRTCLLQYEALFVAYKSSLGAEWLYHLRFSLFYGLGWALFFSSLAGALLLIKLNIRKAAILCSFPLIYYSIAGQSYLVYLRYMLPLIPFFCVTAAVFTVNISNRINKHLKPALERPVTFAIAILIIIPSVYNVILFNRLLSERDNRLIAAEWVNENVKGGSSFYQSGSPWGRLQLPLMTEELEKIYEDSVAKGGQGRLAKAEIDYHKTKNIVGYETWEYDSGQRKFIFNGREKDILPDYIIIEESPLALFSKPPVHLNELLRDFYNLKKSFKAININAKGNLFDQQDAFYMPFIGFKGVTRPGPNIYIYERNAV
ncbi:MAG: glycosyltransferase family 39 protein [Candidatus Omnitrophota bacterium]